MKKESIMNHTEQKQAAKKFAIFWQKYKEGQNEIQITQKFWLNLLRTVYGVENVEEFIDFEAKVRVDGKSKRIDGLIPSTKVLIEQKKRGITLDHKINQSDKLELTPYEQAKRYADHLPNKSRPNWIVTCNFDEFHIHDLNSESPERYETVRLEDLPNEYHRMKFLQDISSTHIYKEIEVSRKAGKLIGDIYTELEKQYGGHMDDRQKHELNVLCVRLVFCLYAEDAGIFDKNQFGDYLRDFPTEMLHYKLKDLFIALGSSNREGLFIDPKAKKFKYVNGGLFSDTTLNVPPITPEVKDLLIGEASDKLDWGGISPTIFGALFESTLNPQTRHDGGMHYTSIENIHKVIDPLFLDDLKDELEDILCTGTAKQRRRKLVDYQEKLAKVNCLDPACGSGNFLTETYLSLRRLENRALKEIYRDGPLMGGLLNPIRVNISQFYGIEINDFAVSVAKTAMWIAEYQMREETGEIVKLEDDFLPLKSYANIHQGNALRTDWQQIVNPDNLAYIIGNPPFLGYSNQNSVQKEDLLSVFVDEKGKAYKNTGKIDYVAGWYMKSALMMQANPKVRAALVSTNSITQGEQVANIWKPLVERFGLHIDFAWRTFRWDSESTGKAHVHCVIIGFSIGERKRKPIIFDGGSQIEAKHVNGYLIDMEDVWVMNNKKPICDVPKMVYGSKPTGNLFVTLEERNELIAKYPDVLPFVRKFLGATEFINSQERYCLWLKEANPSVVRKCPIVLERIEEVRNERLKSTKAATRKLAETPMLFDEDRQPESDYILVPRHSSERRIYIPMGFVNKDVICGDANQLIPNATTYDFGILTSILHMAWMRVVCGRLEMRYRYSADIVYNNFPWPEATEEQKQKISDFAQRVLDARASHPDWSLADLYHPDFMPQDLRRAHKELDKAVLKLYGLKSDIDEMDIVRHLLELYKRYLF